jgi:Squalene/phytoene synthase
MHSVQRLWRTVGQLRHRMEIRQIAALQNPRQFLDAVFTASAGNLAVAAAFLPSSRRVEGTVAFLCCRALDACEDLATSAEEAKIHLRHCVAYLSGACDCEPSPNGDARRHDSDQLEHLILTKLCWVRTDLGRLPTLGRQRVEKLIADVGAEMMRLAEARRIRDPQHVGEYADGVLGRVVKYCFDLLGLQSRWTVDYGSIARVTQIANDLRDRYVDRETASASPSQTFLTMLLAAIEPATSVPGALSGFRFASVSRARAAVVYVVATSTRFYLRLIGVPLNKRLQSPLRTALICMISARAFTRFLVELEDLISVCATTVCSSLFAGALKSSTAQCASIRVDRRLSDFEASLALSLPSPRAGLALSSAIEMARIGTHLRANLPIARLTADAEVDGSHSSVLLSDYLFGAAVFALEPLGLEVLASFADFLAAEAENSERTGALADERGELAALLTRIAMSASGQFGRSAIATESRNRSLGQLYYRMDRAKSSLLRMPVSHYKPYPHEGPVLRTPVTSVPGQTQ